MLEWCGIMPVGQYRENLDIRTSASRSPRAIARDLCRRLLPKYATEYTEAVAAKEAEELYIRTRDAQLAIVAAAVGVEVPADKVGSRESRTQFELPTRDFETSCRVVACDRAHVRLDITLPTERAVQVLALLYPRNEETRT